MTNPKTTDDLWNLWEELYELDNLRDLETWAQEADRTASSLSPDMSREERRSWLEQIERTRTAIYRFLDEGPPLAMLIEERFGQSARLNEQHDEPEVAT